MQGDQNKPNVEFFFDDISDSELDMAIRQQTQQAIKPNPSKNENTDEDDNNDTTSKGSATQSNKDNLDYYRASKAELEEFFDKKMNPNTITDNGEEDEEEEDEQEEGEEENTEEDNNQIGDSSNEDDDLLAIIRQEGLLDIPDDFTEELTAEKLEEFKIQTKERQREQIVNEMRSRVASNPKAAQTLEYFLTGEEFADVPYYNEIEDYIEAYSSYDLDDPEIQRGILNDWLREGLDPNNPAHVLRLNRIEEDVEQMIEGLEGKKQAKAARDYFLSKFNDMKATEIQRVATEKYAKDQQIAIENNNRLNWHRSFQSHVNKTPWNNDKKQSILAEQYNEVVLNDGRKMPVWYAKELRIKSNPELYAVYLNWLNESFDLNTGQFKTGPTSVKMEAERKLLQLAQKKASGNRHRSTDVDQLQRRQRVVPPKIMSEKDLLG